MYLSKKKERKRKYGKQFYYKQSIPIKPKSETLPALYGIGWK